MKKIPRELEGVDLKQLIDYLEHDGGDGWTIWHADKFQAMGFDSTVLPIEQFRSDTSDPKSTIFKDGEIVKETTGVHGLRILRRLAGWLDVKYQPYMGRGSEARSITGALLPVVKKLANEKASKES